MEMVKKKSSDLVRLEPTISSFKVQGGDHYPTISDAKRLSKNHETHLEWYLFLYSKFHLPSTTPD